MKQNLSKKSKVFLVLAMSFFMFATCVMSTVPAQAKNIGTESDSFTFQNSLAMEANVNTPPVTFKFDIVPGDAKEAEGSSPAILKGTIDGLNVTEAEYTSADKGEIFDDETVVIKDVTVSFPDKKFTAPGIYRYIIKMINPNQAGISIDSEPEKVLDVFVTYKEGSDSELEISNYLLHPSVDDDLTTVEKSIGFSNQYMTNNLRLTKNVTGNQGDRDKYFEFKISISDAIPQTVYDVDLANADASPNVDESDKTNLATFTAEDGSVTATYYLKDDQSIVIQGLTEDTKYTITETSYANDGYTTSYKIDSSEEADGNATPEGTIDGVDVSVIFINDKQGTVPTGIINEFGPFVLLGVVVLGGFVLLIGSRKRRSY